MRKKAQKELIASLEMQNKELFKELLEMAMDKARIAKQNDELLQMVVELNMMLDLIQRKG